MVRARERQEALEKWQAEQRILTRREIIKEQAARSVRARVETRRIQMWSCIREMMDENIVTRLEPGRTRIPISVPSYEVAEIMEALDSLTSGWVTMGARVKRFEEMWAEYNGVRHGVMVNSGSSANLLALSALGLKPGDEVITPALTWATTVFPIAQVGAVPVLVDVDPGTYNIDPHAVEAAITPRTRAIMLVHLLGNPCDMDKLRDVARRQNLYLVEDACEAHGAEYDGKKAGSFGDVSTFSFFFSHHISTIEGGMVMTNDSGWADVCRSMRAHGWIRDLPEGQRSEVAAQHPDIDPRFLFLNPGYNFRPTEIQGAFGIHQVPRLEGFIERRRQNAAYFNKMLAPYQDFLQLPSEAKNTRHSYFAYAITVKKGAPFTKQALVAHLESRGLETRPIESGNMAAQPAMKRLNYRAGPLKNTEHIHKNGFFFGVHQGIGPEEREAVAGYFKEFFEAL